MVGKSVRRRICRGEELDVEAIEETPRQEFGRSELFLNLVVDRERIAGFELLPNAEQIVHLVLQPDSCGGAAKQVPVAGEYLPDVARTGSAGFPIAMGNAE